jgi:hypothetical protein
MDIDDVTSRLRRIVEDLESSPREPDADHSDQPMHPHDALQALVNDITDTITSSQHA